MGEGVYHERSIERTYTKELTYRYFVSLPEGYEAKADTTWPMILFLHGGGTPNEERLKRMTATFRALPAIVVAPMCPLSSEGGLYTNWHWRMLGELVREVSANYRVNPKMRSVTGHSMGGSAAWELPFWEPDLFSKSVVSAGVCHPWSLRHFPKIPVWVFVGAEDYMRKEQQETVTSAQRFGVDVVETVVEGANHGGIFRTMRNDERVLKWFVSGTDLREGGGVETGH